MKKSILRQIIKEEINKLSAGIHEDTIGQFIKKIDVIYKIDKTTHASDRQTRHGDKVITDELIVNTVNKAIPKLANALIFDKLDIGNPIVIHDRANDLNVVGNTRQAGEKIQFAIITVMIKQNFRPKENSYEIFV